MKRDRIKLVITRSTPDGGCWRVESTIASPDVTPLMFEVADELAYVMAHNKRPRAQRKTKRNA